MFVDVSLCYPVIVDTLHYCDPPIQNVLLLSLKNIRGQVLNWAVALRRR
jgi:hypothetical protein